MPPPRFYSPDPLAAGARARLPAEAAHHAIRVLRMRQGDTLLLFDGSGQEFQGRIEAIDRDGVVVAVATASRPVREAPLPIALAQGISSGERMDYTLQKAVELGVSEIWPVQTERSVVRLSGERAAKRLSHWQRVVISACEQSGRTRVPPVHPVADLGEWLSAAHGSGCRIMLTPEGGRRLADLARPGGSVLLLVGPEGGLSPAERSLASAHGFLPVRLGPRILRTETAALAAMAAIHALWGDF